MPHIIKLSWCLHMIGILCSQLFKVSQCTVLCARYGCERDASLASLYLCALYQMFAMLIRLQLMTSSPLKLKVLPRNVSVTCYLHFSKLLGYPF